MKFCPNCHPLLLSDNFVCFYLIINIIIVGLLCLYVLCCFCNCHGVQCTVSIVFFFFFVLGTTLYRHIAFCVLDKIDNNNI